MLREQVRDMTEFYGFDPSDARARDVPLFPSAQGKVVSKAATITSWTRLLASVTNAETAKERRVRGHSARRSGAKALTRLGWPREAVQFLGRWGGDTVDIYVGEVRGETALQLDQRTGTGTRQRQEAIKRPWEDTACFWGEFEDLRLSLRAMAEDLSISKEDRRQQIKSTHQAFCRTLNQRLEPLKKKLDDLPAGPFPPPPFDAIRAEVRLAMDTMERYAFNSKPGHCKWHRLPHTYAAETLGALQAYCGWKVGISPYAEVSYTLGTGERCKTCFGKEAPEESPEAQDGDNSG